MEKKHYPLEKADLASLRTAQSRKILKHVLSPLEQVAFKNGFQPFTYTVEKDVSIYVSHFTCRQLLSKTKEKLDLMLNCSDKMHYFKDIPVKHRDVFDDPRIILSLPPVLRNRLCRLDCYTLISILKHGRKYFIENLRVGEVKHIDALFKKYNCSTLFI